MLQINFSILQIGVILFFDLFFLYLHPFQIPT